MARQQFPDREIKDVSVNLSNFENAIRTVKNQPAFQQMFAEKSPQDMLNLLNQGSTGVASEFARIQNQLENAPKQPGNNQEDQMENALGLQGNNQENQVGNEPGQGIEYNA